MKHLQAAFTTMRANRYQKYTHLDVMERYIFNGEEGALDELPLAHRERITGNNHPASYWLSSALPAPSKWKDTDRRAAAVILCVSPRDLDFEDKISSAVKREGPDEDGFLPFREAWTAAGRETDELPDQIIDREIVLMRSGHPNSIGRFLLAFAPPLLKAAVENLRRYADPLNLVELLASERPDLLVAWAPLLLRRASSVSPEESAVSNRVASIMLATEPKLAAEIRSAVVDEDTERSRAFRMAHDLFQHDPERDRNLYFQTVMEAIAEDSTRSSLAAAKAAHAEFGVKFLHVLREHVESSSFDHASAEIAKYIGGLGASAGPILLAYLAAMDRDELKNAVRGSAVRPGWRLLVTELLAAATPQHPRVLEQIRDAIEAQCLDQLPGYARLAGRWDPDAARPLLLDLLKHKSKPVRLAAARAIGRGSDTAEILAEAKKLLPAKKADTRTAAVLVLGGIAGSSPEAVAALEEVLDTEDVDDVRDAALRELAALDRQAGRTPTRADVLARIDKAEARGRLDPAALPDWLDATKLPGATWADGEKLTDREVVYLLHRQSRAKEIVADLEAAPMYALLGDTAELAEAVLQSFLASKVDAKDRWALAVAGLLGDDRIVRPLKRAALEWPTRSRGKMAEYAVQALGLIGTDTALSAVDEAARRFESKQKNVGRAAVEALQAAAEARGVSLDELGDGIVPWLGFEHGPRTVDCGGVPFEISVGPDLKFRYRNLEKDKVVKSLPKTADPALKQELKVAAVTLREVGKAQVRRMENLMVQQRRWPADAWERLFLHHPILRPLATRLVWAGYDGDTPTPVFRPLADGTLTDTEDEAVELPTSAIGLVHPLELTGDERAAWSEHLTDYEVSPPFPQLDRPAVDVPEGRERDRSLDAVAGEKLNALTFRSRAEKLGWVRGSVADGAGIGCYLKRFPAAGVDCLLPLDGFFIGVGYEDEVTLGEAVFAKHGSYEVGSYTYDEPLDPKDKRVVAIGEVPAIAYSEAVGGLRLIAGNHEGDSNEE